MSARIDFHRWLQWLAHRQLKRVQDEAAAAGLRIGLYLDFAVGSAPDGSAAWSAPELTMPAISIGAPPDPFSTHRPGLGAGAAVAVGADAEGPQNPMPTTLPPSRNMPARSASIMR